MLNEKQRQVLELLAQGVSERKAVREAGVNRGCLWTWKRKNSEFREAMGLGAIVVEKKKEKEKMTALERLRKSCLIAAMRELKKRLRGPGIKEVEAKDLLAIVDRVGKLADEGAGPSRNGSAGEVEEVLVGQMSDETRRRLYEIIVGESKGTERNEAK